MYGRVEIFLMASPDLFLIFLLGHYNKKKSGSFDEDVVSFGHS